MWGILLSYETFLHLDCGVNVVSTCEAKYIGIEKREEKGWRERSASGSTCCSCEDP